MNWLASYFEIGLSVGALALLTPRMGCASFFNLSQSGLAFSHSITIPASCTYVKHRYANLRCEQVRIENLTTHEILYTATILDPNRTGDLTEIHWRIKMFNPMGGFHHSNIVRS